MKPLHGTIVGLMGLVLAAAGGCTAVDSDEPGADRAELVGGGASIARGSQWTYWDRGGDLGSAWRAAAFDDSAWAVGAGPLGYGETYLATTIGYGADASHKYITSYFRRGFNVADPAAVTALRAELMYDDGVVVYLNGTEVKRLHMPAGAITAATLSPGHETGNTYEPYDLSAARNLLVAGPNVIAVEVHQAAGSSSDLTFDLALTVEASAPPPANDIPRRSAWTYWDRGGDQGASWRGRVFDASTWRTGAAPLGYGEPYLATTIGYGPDASHKYITSYFRRAFNVADPAAITALRAELMYDDGVVVYLNGTEVKRLYMPAGAVTASTLSTGHETGNNYETYDLSSARNLLVAGTNVIAVEVHQVAGSSSDLTFDLALAVEAGGPPPPPPPHDILRRSAWSYWDRGGDLGSAWRARAFDDDAWASGGGPLGYGETYLATTIGYGGDASHKYITSYFRRELTVDDPALVTGLRAELMYDDGVVVYLNGTEVKRLYMPAGAVTASTLSTGHETGNNYEAYDLSAARNLLVAGTNVVAVEVHQAAASSSDLTFDLALAVDTGCASAPIAAWTGTSEEGIFGSGGGSVHARAEVHWTLARTDGCVDHYTPSGTAYDLDTASSCQELAPTSAPIEAGDGELVIDRSTSPATYSVHGRSEWPGQTGCSNPADENYPVRPATLSAEWAVDDRGAFDANVISGGLRPNDGRKLEWSFTADGASFPAPAPGACAEVSSARWDTVTTSGNGTAGVTWTRVSTTGCVDQYQPSGTLILAPIIDESPNAFCRSRTYVPDRGPIGANDGTLLIDRSTNPPTFDIRGGTRFVATETCEHPDGTIQTGSDFRGGEWARYAGAYQGNRWSGATAPDSNLTWSFTRR